jgi:type VI secretion system secreted protein VgrG
VVDFLEGDPDLPIITGRVYNAVQVPPYTLPDNKTVSTLKSQSSVGGTTANANELRFEDKMGEEYIWFQAEKDMRHLVKNDSNTWIKANEHRIVGGDLLELVGGKHQVTVDGDESVKIKGKHELDITGDSLYRVAGTLTQWSPKIVIESGGPLIVGAADKISIGADGAIILKSNDSLSINAPTLKFQADTKISLKVGGNFVVIDSSGVSIKGAMVNINTGGSADAADAPDNETPVNGPDPDKPAEPEDPLTPAA